MFLLHISQLSVWSLMLAVVRLSVCSSVWWAQLCCVCWTCRR